MYTYKQLLKYDGKDCKVNIVDGSYCLGNIYVEPEDNTITVDELNSILQTEIDFDDIASIEIIEDKDAIDEA